MASVTKLSIRNAVVGWGLLLTKSIFRFLVNPTFSLSLSSNSIAGLSAVPSLAKQQGYAISSSVLRTGRESNICNRLRWPNDSGFQTPGLFV